MEVNTLNKQEFIAGGGEAGQMIRSTNWSSTAVGEPVTWPQSLHTTISIILQSHVPMFIAWGPSGTLFFNDACLPLIEGLPTQAMGRPAQTAFAGNWNNLAPVFDQAMQGVPVTLPDITFFINRHGNSEQTGFTLSGIPIANEKGEPGGMLVTATENTARQVADYKKIYDILLQLPIGILIVRMPDHIVELANNSFSQITGRQVRELTGRRLYDVSPALKGQPMEQFLTQVIQSGQSHIENGLPIQVTSDGIPVMAYFNFLFYPLLEPDGSINGVMLVGREVTENVLERKQAENAVRQSERQFRQLADSMPQIVWTANADGYVDYYNKQWYRLIGDENQFGDNSFLVHVHPDDQVRCIESWHTVVRSGEPYEIEFRFKVKYPVEGYQWFLVRALPIKNDSGQIIKWYGTCTDIDEVKRIEQTLRENRFELEKRVAERTHEISYKNKALEETTQELTAINHQLELRHEELRRSEERYLRMTNEVEDYAIILLSKEGYIENWNKGAEKIKGYTSEEIIGKHFRLFYTPGDQYHGLAERLIEEATERGKSTYEGLRVRKDGSTFWGYTVITALHDDKNDIIGFSKVTRDLTERKMAEDRLKTYAEQLEQKNRELERSNMELSSFSYVASHDLQEPLRKIQAFGNLIQSKDAAHLSDNSKDYFDRMVKAAVRMQNLIDSLLEFSRTTTARKNFESTDLNVLLDEVKKELAHRIEEKKAEITSAHLPTLLIIPFQFRQLLSNLISNSLKYSQKDSTPVIEITATYVKAAALNEKDALPGKDYFKFGVADNGIGFEQEYAEKVFDLFQRLHGRNEYSGSGIGLAICKKIVENHHGFMRAESEPEKGATFFFFIPAVK
jgi:PAS domain S-box-containing protein